MKKENSSILDRLNPTEPDEATYQQDGEYKAFGVSRHAVSMNCILRTGNQIGIAWSLYSDASYDPEHGIVVEFSHKTVALKGLNLLALYQFMLGNRVTFIAEADRATARLMPQDVPVIVEILIVQQADA